MSKTRKIRRARRTRDAAIEAAKKADARVRDALARSSDANKRWDFVVEVLKQFVPEYHLLRAIAESPRRFCRPESASRLPVHIAAIKGAPLWSDNAVSECELTTHALYPLLADAGDKPYESGYVVEVQHGDQVAAMALDKKALAAIPISEIETEVSKQIARKLLHLLQQDARK